MSSIPFNSLAFYALSEHFKIDFTVKFKIYCRECLQFELIWNTSSIAKKIALIITLMNDTINYSVRKLNWKLKEKKRNLNKNQIAREKLYFRFQINQKLILRTKNTSKSNKSMWMLNGNQLRLINETCEKKLWRKNISG